MLLELAKISVKSCQDPASSYLRLAKILKENDKIHQVQLVGSWQDPVRSLQDLGRSLQILCKILNKVLKILQRS